MSNHPYQPVENAFRDGVINEQSNDSLSSFLVALSNEVVTNENVRHRDTFRGLTINHILLQRHINALDKKSTSMQKWFMVFAIISTIGTLTPVIQSFLKKSLPIAQAPQKHKETLPVTSPSPVQKQKP